MKTVTNSHIARCSGS